MKESLVTQQYRAYLEGSYDVDLAWSIKNLVTAAVASIWTAKLKPTKIAGQARQELISSLPFGITADVPVLSFPYLTDSEKKGLIERVWYEQNILPHDGKVRFCRWVETDGKVFLRHSQTVGNYANVRETATLSTDNGATWKPMFDMIFKPHQDAKSGL